MMEFNFVDASHTGKFKATIQITSRLSFNVESAKLMNLKNKEYFEVAFDVNNEYFQKIYLIDSDKKETAARIYKSGPYHYIILQKPLTKFGIDYIKNSYVFTIDKMEELYNDKEVFALTLIEKKERIQAKPDSL